MDDIRALAQMLAHQLAPFLPQLFKVGDKALEEVGKKLGGGAVEGLKKLWPRVREKPAAAEAAEDLAGDPGDALLLGALQVQLQKILKADPDLARLLGSVTTLQVQGSGAAASHGGTAAGAGGVAVRGDVHGDIYIGGAEKPATTWATLRTAYLERLIRQAGFLSLAGIDPAAADTDREARLSLDAVYTALLTRSPRQERWLLKRGAPVPESSRRHSALAKLNQYQYLVLLGDPGGGKSTFVSFVALCLAGEILGRKGINLKTLRAPLPEEEGSGKRRRPQPWRHQDLLPVRVVLRDFAARGLPRPGEKAAAHHLWDFIALDLTEAGLGEFASLLKAELLEKGGLVLLDGLDEVPEADRRRQQIRDIILAFVESFGQCRVLLTSRTYAYQKQEWWLPGFATAELAPFTPAQIALFVSRWYAELVSLGRLQEGDAAGRAELLKRAIFHSERLQELAERPLLLTLMASLHAWRGGSLPEKRVQLYSDAVELLLNLWEKQRVVYDAQGTVLVQQPSLAEWLKVDREKVRWVLEDLAYQAHSSQPDLAGTADIAEKDLIYRFLDLSHPRPDHDELVSYLRDRAGLLVARGVGVYTFPHRTFQEYLAACHLTRSSYPDLLAKLARKDPDRWREVLLLAGAKEPASVWYLADALCWRERPDDPAAGAEDVWGAHLAGQAVMEASGLEGISESNRPKLERLRRWHVRLIGDFGLPPRERALAGRNLASLGDPRFDPERWYLPKGPLLGFVKVPAGPFLMGSDKKRDPGAFDSELPKREVVLPEYWIARYPVTVEQFRAFVAASAYEPRGEDWAGGAANVPVTGVSWHDSLAYCRWLGGELREWAKSLSQDEEAFWVQVASGRVSVTLPSEAEWEKAARGTAGRIFPWGEREDPGRASYDKTRIGEPSTVGCFPGGASSCGCEEMSGNVWEWTRSLHRVYPYEPADGREDLTEHAQGPRVLRGGSYFSRSRYARCACRLRADPSDRRRNVGFRVVLSPFFSGL